MYLYVMSAEVTVSLSFGACVARACITIIIIIIIPPFLILKNFLLPNKREEKIGDTRRIKRSDTKKNSKEFSYISSSVYRLCICDRRPVYYFTSPLKKEKKLIILKL